MFTTLSLCALTFAPSARSNSDPLQPDQQGKQRQYHKNPKSQMRVDLTSTVYGDLSQKCLQEKWILDRGGKEELS